MQVRPMPCHAAMPVTVLQKQKLPVPPVPEVYVRRLTSNFFTPAVQYSLKGIWQQLIYCIFKQVRDNGCQVLVPVVTGSQSTAG